MEYIRNKKVNKVSPFRALRQVSMSLSFVLLFCNDGSVLLVLYVHIVIFSMSLSACISAAITVGMYSSG